MFSRFCLLIVMWLPCLFNTLRCRDFVIAFRILSFYCWNSNLFSFLPPILSRTGTPQKKLLNEESKEGTESLLKSEVLNENWIEIQAKHRIKLQSKYRSKLQANNRSNYRIQLQYNLNTKWRIERRNGIIIKIGSNIILDNTGKENWIEIQAKRST